MRFRHSIAAHIVLIALALPMFAYRREYLVTLDGTRKAGSEVCFYHSGANSALELYFTPGKVVCLPADAVLDLPPGMFSFFARHKDGFASMLRDYTIYNGLPIPERGYEQLEIPLVPAGIVEVAVPLKALGVNESIGLWVAPTPTTLGSFIPLVMGESSILAPANTPLIPLLLRDGAPVAIGSTIFVEEGDHVAMAAFTQTKETSDVFVWLKLDRDAWRQARSVLQAPEVTVTASGKTFKPIFTLFEPTTFTPLIFRDVPLGPAELRLGGTMWKPVKRALIVERAVTVEREALPMVAGGSVRVHWSGDRPAPRPTGCTGSSADGPRIAIGVLTCTQAGPDQRCTPVAAKSMPYLADASLSIDGVPAGSYTVAVRPPAGKEQRFPVEIAAGQQETIAATIPSFEFFGIVKVNGEPVNARLVFATGEAVSEETGRYTASLAADPLTNNVRVELCGHARWFDYFPTESIRPNSAHNIDLWSRHLTVHVTDAENRPLNDAAVTLCVVKQFGPDGITPLSCRHSYPAGTTDDHGDLVAEVPAQSAMRACVTHKSFSQKCSTVAAHVDLSQDDRLLVQFDPVGLHGRVEGHAGEGVLTFVSPTGTTTESVQLDPDGTFVTRLRHAPPEHFVYASRNRPLTVLPMPLVATDELLVAVPPAPVRTFRVTVPGMTVNSAFVGVWIGGNYVPLLTMDFHETARGVDSVLRRGKSVEFRDISETGPIAIAFGVPPDSSATQFVDVFTLPQFAGVERHPVNGTVVTLHD